MKPLHLLSLSRAAKLLDDAAPTRVQAAADLAGVVPLLTIDGVAHFDESDLGRLRKALDEVEIPRRPIVTTDRGYSWAGPNS